MPGTSGSPCSVSRIDFGWPGRLMISACFRITPTWRERIAVGTNFRLIRRICSPTPGITLSATASVASGVTSRGAGPVPPVVSTRWQPRWSTSSFNVLSIAGRSSAISRVSSRHLGAAIALASHSFSEGMPSSLYTPAEARSLMETSPMINSSLMRVLPSPHQHSSSRRRGWSIKGFQDPEELAERVADERAQLLRLGAGVLRHVVGERLVVGQQFFAQGFQAPVARRLLRGAAGERIELRTDRVWVDVAHQAADVLQLAPLAFVGGDALGCQHCLAQRLGNVHPRKLGFGQLDQGDAELLQLEHFFFAFGVAA